MLALPQFAHIYIYIYSIYCTCMNVASLSPENQGLDVNKVPPLACILYLSLPFLLFDVEEVHVLYMNLLSM